MVSHETSRSSAGGAVLIALAVLAACGAPSDESVASDVSISVSGSPDWSRSRSVDDINDRDQRLALAHEWTGQCDSVVMVPAEDGGDVSMTAYQYAGEFGDLSALNCALTAARRRLADAPTPTDVDYDATLGFWPARMFYHVAYRADLRGRDLEDELTILCDVWGWRLAPENVESVARRDFADAVEAGLMTPEDFAAAKTRDAARPTCSERLIAEGAPRAD